MYEDFWPVVVQVVPQDGYRVLIYFNDGKITMVDMTDRLRGPVFEPLRDPEMFRRTCCVMNETLAWDVEGTRDPSRVVDVDPLVLYELPSVNDEWANEGRGLAA